MAEKEEYFQHWNVKELTYLRDVLELIFTIENWT